MCCGCFTFGLELCSFVSRSLLAQGSLCIQNALAVEANRALQRWTIVLDVAMPAPPQTDYYSM